VLDLPLLLENDDQHELVRECDILVFVDADPAAREARARAARGWGAGEVARREAAQMPLDAKRARADDVHKNRGDLALLERDARTLRAAWLDRTRDRLRASPSAPRPSDHPNT
jgi:dephospho-CoA kinase